MVVTFLAVLELVRLRLIRVWQVEAYGAILVEAGETRQGLDLHKRAVEREPKVADFRLNYAQALRDSGDTTAARTQFETVVRDFPGSPAAARAGR